MSETIETDPKDLDKDKKDLLITHLEAFAKTMHHLGVRTVRSAATKGTKLAITVEPERK